MQPVYFEGPATLTYACHQIVSAMPRNGHNLILPGFWMICSLFVFPFRITSGKGLDAVAYVSTSAPRVVESTA